MVASNECYLNELVTFSLYFCYSSRIILTGIILIHIVNSRLYLTITTAKEENKQYWYIPFLAKGPFHSSSYTMTDVEQFHSHHQKV